MGELIGLLAGCVGMVQAIPQVRQIRSLGHGRGVNLTSWVLTLVVQASWLGYGTRIDSPAVLITNAAGGVLAAAVVIALVHNPKIWAGALLLAALAVASIVQLVPAGPLSIYLVTLTAARAPQALESYRNFRHARATAVSLTSLYFMATSLVLWEVFALMEHRGLMLVTTSLALALTVAIAGLEIGAGKRHVRLAA